MKIEPNVYKISGKKGAEMILKSPGDYVVVEIMMRCEEILHEYPKKYSKVTAANRVKDIGDLTYCNEDVFGRIYYEKGDRLCNILFAL